MLLKGKEKDKMTEEEVASTCILLAIAGHETTVNLISNSILCLLQHPEQLLELKENPDLIATAVEECLRFESPTQMTARVASEDIDISGVTIRKGEQVYLLLGLPIEIQTYSRALMSSISPEALIRIFHSGMAIMFA